MTQSFLSSWHHMVRWVTISESSSLLYSLRKRGQKSPPKIDLNDMNKCLPHEN